MMSKLPFDKAWKAVGDDTVTEWLIPVPDAGVIADVAGRHTETQQDLARREAALADERARVVLPSSSRSDRTYGESPALRGVVRGQLTTTGRCMDAKSARREASARQDDLKWQRMQAQAAKRDRRRARNGR